MYVTAHSMLRSDGVACKHCARNMGDKKEKYIAKAKELHGDQYDYSKFDFSENPATFICKKHGEFKQTRRGHFDNYYDYSKSEFVDTRTIIKIICPKHGTFSKKPCDHIKKPRYPGDKSGGCKLCNIVANFEVMAMEILNRNKIEYEYQFMFSDFKYRWDFVIRDLNVVIEIDEKNHRSKYLQIDLIKGAIMKSRGYKTYRITVKTIEEIFNFESRFKKILASIIRYKVNNKLFSNILDLAAYLKIDKNTKLSVLDQYKFKPL